MSIRKKNDQVCQKKKKGKGVKSGSKKWQQISRSVLPTLRVEVWLIIVSIFPSALVVGPFGSLPDLNPRLLAHQKVERVVLNGW